MKILPSFELLIESRHTKERVMQILKENKHWLTGFRIAKIFAWLYIAFEEDSFTVILGDNIAKGSITEDDGKTKLNMTMSPSDYYGLIIMVFGMLMVIIAIVFFQSVKLIVALIIFYILFLMLQISTMHIRYKRYKKRYIKTFRKILVDDLGNEPVITENKI